MDHSATILRGPGLRRRPQRQVRFNVRHMRNELSLSRVSHSKIAAIFAWLGYVTLYLNVTWGPFLGVDNDEASFGMLMVVGIVS